MLHLRQICVGRTVQKEMQDGLYAVESLFLRMLIDDECKSVFLYAALIAMSHVITADTHISDAKPDKGVRYEISGRDHHGYALHIRYSLKCTLTAAGYARATRRIMSRLWT